MATVIAVASMVVSLVALAFRTGRREGKAREKVEEAVRDLNGVAGKARRRHKLYVQAIVMAAPSKAKAEEIVKLLVED